MELNKDIIVEFNSVNKNFQQGERTFHALKEVSLTINRGEHVAIVGKSGSGKSTMLNLITGIDHPTSGTIRILDQDIHDFNENELARWRGKSVGIVFQFFQLIPTLTILENILLAMEFVNSVPKKERLGRAGDLLKMVGIEKHQNKFPSALSGGEQQRAAISRALANDPEILVADEPTGNLDSENTQVVHAIFDGLISQGKTLIIVTHENIEHRNYDTIIRLNDGCLENGRGY